MGKTIGEFLHHLVTKSGMNPDDEKVKGFLLNGELMKIELPDEVEKGIDNQLISIKDAKNNHQEIRNFYYAQALDSVDRGIRSLVDEEGDDEFRKSVMSQGSSYQRVEALVKGIKERESKKANASKPDKAEIQKEIDRLHIELKAAQEATQTIKTESEQNLKNVKLDYALDKKILPYKTIFDELDPEVKRASIKTVLNKELQDNRVKFAIDERDAFSLLKEDGTSYYGDNHQLITPESFIEKTLSRNKLLITTSKPPPNGDTNRQQPNNANGASTKNPTLSGLVQDALRDVTNNQTAVSV